MSNFALIPQGTTVVFDVVVASQQFIDNAPAEWKGQWSYIVNVDGVACGAGWVYDPSSGAFYPPSPPSPNDSEHVVSYDQLLVQQGWVPDITGARFVVGSDPANLDVSWDSDRMFPGIELQAADFTDGDTVDLVAIHPITGAVVGAWGTNVPIPPNGQIKTVLSAAALIPMGVVVRLVYRGSVGARVYVTYRTWWKP